MNDKQLADTLVEAGIGDCRNGGYTINESYINVMGHITGVDDAENFVNDWRVAGACMGRLSEIEVTGQMKEQLPAK